MIKIPKPERKAVGPNENGMDYLSILNSFHWVCMAVRGLRNPSVCQLEGACNPTCRDRELTRDDGKGYEKKNGTENVRWNPQEEG